MNKLYYIVYLYIMAAPNCYDLICLGAIMGIVCIISIYNSKPVVIVNVYVNMPLPKKSL